MPFEESLSQLTDRELLALTLSAVGKVPGDTECVLFSNLRKSTNSKYVGTDRGRRGSLLGPSGSKLTSASLLLSPTMGYSVKVPVGEDMSLLGARGVYSRMSILLLIDTVMRLSTDPGRQLNGAHSHSALYWIFFPHLRTLLFIVSCAS